MIAKRKLDSDKVAKALGAEEIEFEMMDYYQCFNCDKRFYYDDFHRLRKCPYCESVIALHRYILPRIVREGIDIVRKEDLDNERKNKTD